MSLEDDLRTIWQKYEPMRQAERDAFETARKARDDLAELNRKRTAMGLSPVGEHHDAGHRFDQMVGSFISPPPKTWRDEMDAAMLVAVKRHFEGGTT